MNRFAQKLAERSIPLRRGHAKILQVNVGKLCNLTCVHCHVSAGPKRKEIMTRETIDRIIDWLGKSEIPTVDLTGGAPEMIPDFRYFIERVTALTQPRHVIDRCNLTILLDPGYQDLPEFLARHKVEIIASMPCYTAENVNAQRGEGVFDGSITALQLLNSLGYGIDPMLPLHLVYNPVGAFLPGSQAELAEMVVNVEVAPAQPLAISQVAENRMRVSRTVALRTPEPLHRFYQSRSIGFEFNRSGTAHTLLHFRSRRKPLWPLDGRIERAELDDGPLKNPGRRTNLPPPHTYQKRVV